MANIVEQRKAILLDSDKKTDEELREWLKKCNFDLNRSYQAIKGNGSTVYRLHSGHRTAEVFKGPCRVYRLSRRTREVGQGPPGHRERQGKDGGDHRHADCQGGARGKPDAHRGNGGPLLRGGHHRHAEASRRVQGRSRARQLRQLRASPCDVQLQNGNLVLWGEVNNELPTVIRRVKFYWTGKNEVDDGAEYIGTVQTNGGSLVWHLYEVH